MPGSRNWHLLLDQPPPPYPSTCLLIKSTNKWGPSREVRGTNPLCQPEKHTNHRRVSNWIQEFTSLISAQEIVYAFKVESILILFWQHLPQIMYSNDSWHDIEGICYGRCFSCRVYFYIATVPSSPVPTVRWMCPPLPGLVHGSCLLAACHMRYT
jgi:hypothetical protein